MHVAVHGFLPCEFSCRQCHFAEDVCFIKIVTSVIWAYPCLSYFPLSLLDFPRLKKIQEKKKQLREKTEKEMAQRLAELGPIAEPANMVDMEKDEDLLFEWVWLKLRLPPHTLFILRAYQTKHDYIFAKAKKSQLFCVYVGAYFVFSFAFCQKKACSHYSS